VAVKLNLREMRVLGGCVSLAQAINAFKSLSFTISQWGLSF